MASKDHVPGTRSPRKGISLYEEDLTAHDGNMRLLRIRPGRRSSQISCTLRTWSLSSPEMPAYRAISYAWGGQETDRNIYVNGHQVAVTSSVHSILWHLCKKKELDVWIDSLCINQQNDSEKTSQVAQMFQIYRTATQVIVWLGDSDDDSDSAMELLQTGSEHDVRFGSVWILLTRPWWERVWVLQEVVAARSPPIIRCGFKEAPWACLDRLERKGSRESWMSHCIRRSKTAHGGIFNHFVNAMPRIKIFTLLVERLRAGRWLSWRDAFALSLTMKATDERDLIYALLALIDPNSRGEFRADYSITDVNTIRSMAVAQSIRSSEALKLLTLTTFDKGLDGPSWAPNLATGESSLFLEAGPVPYHAAGQAQSLPRWSDDYAIMWINGAVLESIAEIAARERPGRIWQARDLAYKTGKRLGLQSQDTKNRFWRTLVGNSQRRYPADPLPEYPAPDEMGLRYMAWQGEIETPREAIGEGFESEWHTEFIKPFWYSMLYQYDRSTFFTTEAGDFGIGPRGVQKHDLVCLLCAGRVAFILRHVEDHYILVGAAYVHGFMDGEKADVLQDRTEVVEFEIH